MCGGSILPMLKVLSLVEITVSVCEQRNRDMDQTRIKLWTLQITAHCLALGLAGSMLKRVLGLQK
jgi:hypothetical protein